MPPIDGQKSRQAGFTMVELVMAMVIAGIIAVVAIPRFFDSSIFQSRGFADQVQASLRYAQKVAIAQRRNVCTVFTSGSLTLSIASASGAASPCNTSLASPTGEASYVISAPAGITFTPVPADFGFDALGRPSTGQSITVAGAADPIVVEAETGYVHAP